MTIKSVVLRVRRPAAVIVTSERVGGHDGNCCFSEQLALLKEVGLVKVHAASPRILYICCKTVDRASLTSWLFAKHPDHERSTKSQLICEVGGEQKIR